MSAIGSGLVTLINLYIYVLIGRLILEYILMFARSWRPKGFVLVIAEFLMSATDPFLKLIRRYIKPIQLGSVALDVSFIVAIFGLSILRNLIYGLFIG